MADAAIVVSGGEKALLVLPLARGSFVALVDLPGDQTA